MTTETKPCPECEGTGLEHIRYYAKQSPQPIRTRINPNRPCPVCDGTGTQE